MAKEFSTDTTPRLDLRCPEDVLAAVPYVLGFHPGSSVVVLAVGGHPSTLRVTARLDIPLPEGDDGAAVAAHTGDVVAAQHGVDGAILVAYGPAGPAERAFGLLSDALHGRDVGSVARIRAAGGRYWSYGSVGTVGCPEEGLPYDIASSPVAASATLAGCVALPDRDALEQSVAALGGAARASMRQATGRAEARLQRWGAASPRAALNQQVDREGHRRVHAALDRCAHGPRLSDDETAWLGLLLARNPVRDEAWLLIDAESRQVHLALWTDVTRRVESRYVPAPACLLAFTAWQDGNGALARVAVDRAQRVDPGYSMARLIAEALVRGIPPDAWQPPMPAGQVRSGYDDQDLPGGH